MMTDNQPQPGFCMVPQGIPEAPMVQTVHMQSPADVMFGQACAFLNQISQKQAPCVASVPSGDGSMEINWHPGQKLLPEEDAAARCAADFIYEHFKVGLVELRACYQDGKNVEHEQ